MPLHQAAAARREASARDAAARIGLAETSPSPSPHSPKSAKISAELSARYFSFGRMPNSSMSAAAR
jgi:hypothetical protein